jgi:hypothetical protein
MKGSILFSRLSLDRLRRKKEAEKVKVEPVIEDEFEDDFNEIKLDLVSTRIPPDISSTRAEIDTTKQQALFDHNSQTTRLPWFRD